MGIVTTKSELDAEPVEKEYSETTRMAIWDELRKTFKINPDDFNNKSDLYQKVRKQGSLKPYQRPEGKLKSMLGFIKKTNFQSKLKKDLTVSKGYEKIIKGKKIKVPQTIRFKSSPWTKGEESVLRGLKQRYKGVRKVRVTWGRGTRLVPKNQALVSEFRRIVKRVKSKSSILTKMSRL